MKKILIPTILTLTTTPFISMVGCNKDEGDIPPIPPQPDPEVIVMDQIYPEFEVDFTAITTPQPVTCENNKPYLFEIHIQEIATLRDEGNEYHFNVSELLIDATEGFAIYDDVDIWLNDHDHPLQQDTDYKVEEYSGEEGVEYNFISFPQSSHTIENLKDGDIIYIQLQFRWFYTFESGEYYFVFYPGN